MNKVKIILNQRLNINTDTKDIKVNSLTKTHQKNLGTYQRINPCYRKMIKKIILAK